MLSLKIERSIKTVCYHFISILGFPTLEALIIRMATGAGALRILDRHVLKSMISSFQLLQLELDQRPAAYRKAHGLWPWELEQKVPKVQRWMPNECRQTLSAKQSFKN